MRQIFLLFCAVLFSQFVSAQCPIIFQLSNQDLHVCEMENFIFTAQFDDESLATVNWTLPDGTVQSTFALGYFFDSSTGCNEVLEFAYEVLCEDDSVLETGNFTVTVYTYNEAIVEAVDCTYTILPDCPNDVEIITDGISSNVYEAVQGTQGSVLVEISNTGAPDECKYNTFNYNFDCIPQDVVSGIETIDNTYLAKVRNGNDIELLADFEIQEIAVFDLAGRNLWESGPGNTSANELIRISPSINGICLLVLRTSDAIYTQKLFLQ